VSERRFAWPAIAVAALLVVGAVVGSYPTYMIGLAMVNVIAAIGLNLLVGNSGQISLCHSSFMAIGAYSAALLAGYARLPFWVAIPCGTALAAGVGALLALPARRLGGIYLALATLGFMQIVQIALEEWSSVTGGVRGLKIPKPELWPGATLTPYAVYAVVVAGCVLAVWTEHNLLRSRLGRELNALRLSPHAAQALGISLARIKLTAFTLSAAYAGFAGGLFAQLVGFIDPNEFGISAAIRQLTFIVVGGVGSLAGSVLGAVVLSGLPELLRSVREYNDLVFALELLAFMLFLPHGLVVLWRGALAGRWIRREAVA
jgi:branched-chain amino acid transport system permease protein